jgi:hypothetical protein
VCATRIVESPLRYQAERTPGRQRRFGDGIDRPIATGDDDRALIFHSGVHSAPGACVDLIGTLHQEKLVRAIGLAQNASHVRLVLLFVTRA